MSQATNDESQGFLGWTADINRKQWLAFLSAFMGWTLDAMDLLLYIYALPMIKETFSLDDKQAALLFGVTLASSAIGGATFGILSDYIGRIRALTLSILIYSIFTGLSAFAPTVWIFLGCRFLLGLGMGGEWAAGEILVAESWPSKHRGKVIGMVQSGWGVGFILAATLAIIILPHPMLHLSLPFIGEFVWHSWRTLFLIGILPAFLVLFIRKHCEEPEIWLKTQRMRKNKELSEVGQSFTFTQLFRGDLLRFTITATLLTSLCMIAYWGLNSWIPTYLRSPVEEGGAGLGLVKGYAWTIAINVGATIGCISFGMISDKLGRKPVFVTYLLVTALLVPLFGSIEKVHLMFTFLSIDQLLLVISPLLGFFGTGFFSGFGAIMTEIFPTRSRGTAQGFCYNMGRGISAIAPFIFASVASLTIAGKTLGYGLSLATASIFAILAAIVVLTLPETKGKDLDIE